MKLLETPLIIDMFLIIKTYKQYMKLRSQQDQTLPSQASRVLHSYNITIQSNEYVQEHIHHLTSAVMKRITQHFLHEAETE